MDALKQDVRFAIRFLGRNPSFTAAAVTILALGISLSATLFAIVRGALIAPWPYRGYDRIVTVAADYPAQGRTRFSLWSVPEVEDFRRESDIFEHVIAGDARDVNLTYAGRPERVRAAVITPNAFEMLGVPALAGRTLTADDAKPGAAPVVVVSFHFWKTRLGGDPEVVGRTLRIGDTTFSIAGIMPRQFVFWDRELWMPLALNAGDQRADRRYYVQAQIRSELDLATASARLRTFAARLAADHPEIPEYAGLSIEIESLVLRVLRDLRPTLYLLLAAVALVLIVATANLANATLAKGMTRAGELAIRRAIGASAGQLARQMLVESALVGVGGGLVGAAAAAFLLPQILALIPYGYVPAEATVELDWRIVASATAAAIACGLAIGLVPAIRAGSIDPAALLKQGETRTGSRRAHRLADAFVFAQCSVAVVVIGAASAAAVSLRTAVNRNPGYRAAGVWTARIALPATLPSDARTRAFEQILRRIGTTPEIVSTALASAFPVGDLPTTLVAAAGAPQAFASRDAAIITVSPAFFRLLNIPIVEGRAFMDADAPPQPARAIVTRYLAQRLWPDGTSLGREMLIGTGADARRAVVVGVAGDTLPNGDDSESQAGVFLPIAHQPPATAVIGVRAAVRADAFAIVSGAVRSVDADIPVYRPELLEQSRLNMLGPRLLSVALLAAFGLAVLALSSVGIYAVVAQSVRDRRRELHIRLTFGAQPGQLLVAELVRAGRLVLAAALTGSVAALVVLRFLAHSFVEFSASPVGAVLASAATLTGLALASVAIPAWRATRFT